MEMRLSLVGVLFGPEAVTRLLTAATLTKDENFIAVTSRALSRLGEYLAGGFGAAVRDDVNQCADQNRHQLHQLRARSAMVGCVGTVNRGRGGRHPDPHLRKALGSVLDHAKVYICLDDGRQMNKAVFLHYEVMWALVQVFDGAPSLGEWSEQIQEICEALVGYWQGVCDLDPNSDREDVEMTKLAKRLLCWEIAPENIVP